MPTQDKVTSTAPLPTPHAPYSYSHKPASICSGTLYCRFPQQVEFGLSPQGISNMSSQVSYIYKAQKHESQWEEKGFLF